MKTSSFGMASSLSSREVGYRQRASETGPHTIGKAITQGSLGPLMLNGIINYQQSQRNCADLGSIMSPSILNDDHVFKSGCEKCLGVMFTRSHYEGNESKLTVK